MDTETYSNINTILGDRMSDILKTKINVLDLDKTIKDREALEKEEIRPSINKIDQIKQQMDDKLKQYFQQQENEKNITGNIGYPGIEPRNNGDRQK